MNSGKHSDRLRAHCTRTDNEDGLSHYWRSASGQKSDIGDGQENEIFDERLNLRRRFKHHHDDGQGTGIRLALREKRHQTDVLGSIRLMMALVVCLRQHGEQQCAEETQNQ